MIFYNFNLRFRYANTQAHSIWCNAIYNIIEIQIHRLVWHWRSFFFVLGNSSCTRLPHTARSYWERNNVENYERWKKYFCTINWISRYVPCCLCIWSLFCTPEIILFFNWKDTQRSGKLLIADKNKFVKIVGYSNFQLYESNLW